ncbi:unnamed protein product [Lactuca virosa]|uniref:SET domain-containing protein n=1 Tax=Lactuca virosa TaxID=75947 RepID=A0AAU9M699_9ASTR|nr:unnamed protein product [Lactuca virosa]
MEVVCPIDAQFAEQIAVLLEPPSSLQLQEYFDELITSKQCNGIQVKPTNDYGKGVYADMEFEEEDLILKDQMLFGVQHSSNKIDCLVCSFCFRFIGSIELQIGRKLYLQGLGSPKDCFDLASEDQLENFHCLLLSIALGDVKKLTTVANLVHMLIGTYAILYFVLEKGQKSLSKKALSRFIEHANETNDIFLLAAKAISSTILKYRKLKAAHNKEKEKNHIAEVLGNHNFSLLLKAWKPLSMGYKRRWWDCIALPDDVDACDEAAFRMQIRQLAFESLELLKDAIIDEECLPLFSLEIYGHIIGMFELNNLDLVVASPVEDYFLYIDDLPEPEKKEVDEITQPFLDALGEDYSVCCQGTAFFALQSCMNHSCCPTAKAFKRDEDRDGQATILASRPIKKGEEITISYIDEELPFEERQALLADYGFRCKCLKCIQEQP